MMLRKNGAKKILKLQNRTQKQFQQLLTIPLSEAPDFKKPKPKRKAHSSLPKRRCTKANDSTNSCDKMGKKLARRANKLENDTSSTRHKDDREVKLLKAVFIIKEGENLD